MPAATLVILLPPLFSPLLVRVTGWLLPPVRVTPSLFTTVLPVVRLSATRSFVVATVMLLPSRVMAMFCPSSS
ncbi:hypothetical protein [Moraxella atlantae]|uniref:hypothetical protein n=1 Tax=Faucicola atlantae TaxID=34059 RepID=UPI0011C02DAD|nr:hypothetical protein [Moraxella atlantae]